MNCQRRLKKFWEKREGYTECRTIINALIQAAEGSARNAHATAALESAMQDSIRLGFQCGQGRTRTGSTRPLFPRGSGEGLEAARAHGSLKAPIITQDLSTVLSTPPPSTLVRTSSTVSAGWEDPPSPNTSSHLGCRPILEYRAGEVRSRSRSCSRIELLQGWTYVIEPA